MREKNNFYKFILVRLPAIRYTLYAFLFLAFIFSQSNLFANEDTVSIGVVAPLTGDQAYIGIGVRQGAQMAIEDSNVKGPVFGDSKLKLIALDDQHNPTQAVLAANKLIADPEVLGVVGHFNSSCTKAASSIYHEARLVQVTPASTNPEISRQGFDTFFRVCATDDVQAPAAADFALHKLGVKKLYTYSVNGAYVVEIPVDQVEKFVELYCHLMRPGYWNEYIGPKNGFFAKLPSGEVHHFPLAGG